MEVIIEKQFKDWRGKNRKMIPMPEIPGYQKLTAIQRYNLRHPERYKLERVKCKTAAFESLGNRCAICGFDDARALQIDHIRAVGKARQRNQNTLYRDVVRHPEKYQLLCANHNWIKRVENGE